MRATVVVTTALVIAGTSHRPGHTALRRGCQLQLPHVVPMRVSAWNLPARFLLSRPAVARSFASLPPSRVVRCAPWRAGDPALTDTSETFHVEGLRRAEQLHALHLRTLRPPLGGLLQNEVSRTINQTVKRVSPTANSAATW